MGITIELSHNCMQTCESSLNEIATQGGRTAWLTPDYARALATRKSLAETKSPLRLGCTVSSLGSWIEDLWALYGDGRALVSPIQRKLIMEEALIFNGGDENTANTGANVAPNAGVGSLSGTSAKSIPDANVSPSTGESLFATNQGTVDLLARMVEQGMGLSDFLNATQTKLSPTEQRMLKAANNYRTLLEKHDLCEPSEAMLLLSQRTDIAWPHVAATGFDKLRLHEAAFFAAISRRTDIRFVMHRTNGSRFDRAQAVAKALEQALLKAFGEGERILVVPNDAEAASADNASTRTGAASTEAVSANGASSGVGTASAGNASTGAVNANERTDQPATPDDSGELASLRRALYHPNPKAPVIAGGSVRTLLPAGRYAQTSLLVEAIRALSGSVLIACNHPSSLFDDLAGRLHAHGISIEGSFTRGFAETDFGSAFLNALALAEEEQPVVSQASDYALSLFAGIDLQKAYEADASWRGSRLTNREDILRALRERKPSSADFIKLLEAKKYTEALDAAEARFGELTGEGEAFRAEQFAATKCVRTLIAEAESLNRDPRDLFHLLERMQLRSGARITVDGATTHVSIISHRDAAALTAYSYDHVFACNLNASEQSLRQNRNSADELFEHLGYEPSHNALFTARLRMAGLLDCARSRLYLVRTLHNEKAEPTYPAVVFEDVVDCYRGIVIDGEGQARIEGVSKTSGLTAALEAFAVSAGEEKLEANLYPTAVVKATTPQGPQDEISSESLTKLREPLVPANETSAGKTRIRMSASAIESYLGCPHKWFANNRLRLNEIDASLSLRESGTLIHEVLFSYYHNLQSKLGTTKPKEDLLEQAEVILEAAFRRMLAVQPQKSLRENPYIPLTQAEHRQTQAILDALKGYIRRDSRFAPDFKPTHFELNFGYDMPFEYAGILLRGSIDRIDVDAKGRAIIVDYKSSLSSSYNLLAASEGDTFALPPKVQTLIYAQVARKLLNLDVIGALYVHTQRASGGKPLACGAYDDRLLTSDDLLKISNKGNALSRSPFTNFEELLDEVENMIAARLEQLEHGAIEVNPQSEDVCTYCPVISCEGRK